MRTLIVEDNAVYRKCLKEMLWTNFPSMIIEEAADGKEALESINSFFPNVIFMDIGLPGENGLQITRKIRSKKWRGTIIILTSHELSEYRNAAYACGANYFLTKSTTSGEEIVSLLQTVIDDDQGVSQHRMNVFSLKAEEK